MEDPAADAFHVGNADEGPSVSTRRPTKPSSLMPAAGSGFEPLGPAFEPLSAARTNQLVWALIALGIAARLVRYWLRFPIWQDEAYLATSFLNRDFLGLMGPLENRQVAPLGFLWVQMASIKLLGFTEYSLRLFPLLCGIGSLLVFRHLAGRLLRGTALVLAVGFLAVAYPAIRYSVEAKQYSCDMFVSLVLLALAVQWSRRPENVRWLWALVIAVPLAVGLSYPAVFIAGGVSVAVAAGLWKAPSRRGWLAWLCYNATLLAAFAAIFALSAANQSANSREFLLGLWQHVFPPFGSPLKFLGWLVMVHTSDMFSYPFGGAHGAGVLTLVCFVAAVVLLVRRRHPVLILLLLCPFALNFVAACIRRYPYGGPVRFSIHLAPIVCLLGGLGASLLLVGTGKRPRQALRNVSVLLLLMAALGFGSIGRDLYKPYKTEEVLRCRNVARAIWHNRAEKEEVVGLRTDLGEDFATREVPTVWALYLCNQRIYSPRHARGGTPHLDRVSASRPLCCVYFHSPAERHDKARLDAWLAKMESRYNLVGCEKHPVPVNYGSRPLAESIDLYRFVPKTAELSQSGPSSTTRR